ncbi:hypothetical protein LTR84_000111 [Exophiala bonariae]|uniref:histidine kinase n=1 Tax=Exophiala bonariae TaxID=1690606 RepID=A0AAV9NTP1_9EURO|nr:hypothetical protein LTR84_000111 [Exophiala bonariae]
MAPITQALPRLEQGIDITVDNPNATISFVPKSSNDSALTAFAQLGALRLNTSRALISLIDSTSQHVLAESTQSLSSQSDDRHDLGDGLWLGSVMIPRKQGICEVVLTCDPIRSATNSEEDISRIKHNQELVIIPDLRDDSRYCTRRYVTDGPQLRFFAGAPLRSVDGTIIGAFCVLDNKPRQDLTELSKSFMLDMSQTIMTHLENVRVQAEFQRRDRLVIGLESFVRGLSSMPRSQDDVPTTTAAIDGTRSQRVPVNAESLHLISRGSDTSSTRSLSMWEMALPSGCKTMFSRASNIIREAGGYDGTAFFYISSVSSTGKSSRRQYQASNAGSHRSRHCSSSSTASDRSRSALPTTTPDAESSSEDLSGNEETNLDGLSPILGFSLSKTDEQTRISDQMRFPRFRLRDLQKLMGTQPRGRVYILDRSGNTFPGDTSSSGEGPDPSVQPINSTTPGLHGSGRSKQRASQVNSLLKIHPQARTFVCLPLWDHNRERWFAFCVCWIIEPKRDPALDGDLHFLRIFCNNITNALSHLDTLDADEAKTSFVASISHELRSPLHGVLGAANFLYDSKLNRFQLEMVDSITSSGRTLLDTLEHVMDFTKINSFTNTKTNFSVKANAENNKVSSALSKDDISRSSLTTSVDLCQLIEEVVEAVFTGFSYQHSFLQSDDATPIGLPIQKSQPQGLAHSRRSVYQRGRVRLALDFQSINGINNVEIQPGAWRRIVMNLVGNALKYTDEGLITVSLQVSDFNDEKLESDEKGHDTVSIILTVNDSGIGMSNEFLQNKLFKPFSQEDSLSSGTGLGLSIVDQIVKSLGGYVDVTSTRGLGTNMTVCVNTRRGKHHPTDVDEQHPQALSKSLANVRVAILEDTASKASKDNPESLLTAEGEFSRILLSDLKRWYGVESTVESSWSPDAADLIICLEPSFGLIQSVRSQAQAQASIVPPMLIISHDALEMAALRDDARIQNKDFVVEITHQPLGPRKLSKVLHRCLERSSLLSSRSSQQAGGTIEPVPTPASTPESLPFQDISTGTPRTLTPISIASTPETPQEVVVSPPINDSVLCVDDNPLNLKLLTTFIKNKGFTPVQASNGQEAVDIFKAANGAFKCVLMDVSMPVLDGMTATYLLRKYEANHSLRRVPVVALTGLASATARNEALESGMDHFLTKPFCFVKLTEIITGLPPTPGAV